ncbi:hypothetical protein GCM10027591_11820 [Zhihengliuella somnathii]
MFSMATAKQVLLDALNIAQSDRTVPIIWTSHSRTVFDLKAMTWTPALATLLLAKATNNNIDTLSLKKDQANPNSYSARGLCHNVIVPAAISHGFSIRNTGREPLNNQPFFRYDRIDKIERTRFPDDYTIFLEIARSANELDEDKALLALAAFIREALARTAATRNISVHTRGLTAAGARIAVDDFLRPDAIERPQRLQAFAAACVGLMQFSHVKTRRINDPSRDVPGDVQVIVNDSAILALEVRGKIVTQADLVNFVRQCSGAGIHRAVMLVDATGQKPLDPRSALRDANAHEVLTAVFESATELLEDALLWPTDPLEVSVRQFSETLLRHLQEIGASPSTIEEWARAVAIAQGR